MRRPDLAVSVVLLAVAVTSAQSASERFAFERSIVTSGERPHRLRVDTTLLSAASPFRVIQRGGTAIAIDGLSDLRLFDSHGRPVPYLVLHPPSSEPDWIAGRMLPLLATKKTSGFEADLGAAIDVDMVRVEGLPAPFLKRCVLEGSGDRGHWSVLVREGTLFDLPAEELRQISLAFAAGRFRYLRIMWDDTNSGRVPMPKVVTARRASRAPTPGNSTAAVTFEPRASEPGRSRYRIRLPGARLPVIALELQVAGGHVFRNAVVMEARLSGTEAVPAELGRSTLKRVVRDGVEASSLRVPITPPAETELELVIDNGNNPPLELSGILAVFAELPWIYFEAPTGSVVARYGDPSLRRPSYDLEALRESIDLRSLPEASWGEPRALTETAAGATQVSSADAGGTLDATGFRYARPVPTASGLVALTVDPATLAHSLGPSRRFADVRLVDSASRQIPYLLERRDEPLSIELPIRPATNLKAPELKNRGSSQSVYVLTLPYPHLPASRVVLETSGRVFHRTVRLGIERPSDRHRRDAWFEVVESAVWRHADQHSAAPALAIRAGTLHTTEMLLAVDEGDNAPLPIATARLLLPSYRLRFYHPAGASLKVVYGRDDLGPPQYDLALLAPQVMGAAAREIAAVPEQEGAAAGEPRSFVSPRVFWVLLSGAVLVLIALIAKLVRS